MNYQGMEASSHLDSFFGPKMSTMDDNCMGSKLVLRAHIIPAGEMTVPVSNKTEGILNKHWHTFLK